jgi:hypothetical protein
MSGDLVVVKDKVQTYLRELVGRYEVDSDGDYTFRDGSARLFVSVDAIKDSTFVHVYAILAKDVPEMADVYEFVATKAGSYRYGSLFVRKQPDGLLRVIFDHSLLGDFLDPDELKIAVSLIAATADELDTEIVDRFGGETFHDEV